jgi:hypothetical protein
MPFYHEAPAASRTDYIALRLRAMVKDNTHCMVAFHVMIMCAIV